MKNAFFLLPLLVLGCSGAEAPSNDPALKASLSKGGDKDAMTAEQKAKMDAYMKNMGPGSKPK